MISRRFRWSGMVAAVAVGVALTLTGCSSNSPATQTKDSTGDVTLNLSSWHDCPSLKSYLDAFEAANPTIKVDCTSAEYADYVTQLKLGLTSGTGPDVFGLQEGVLTQQFAPLAENLAPLAEKALGSGWKNKILFADAMSVKGKQVALPQDVLLGGTLFYNKTLLDSLNIAFPKDLDQWVKACDSLQAAGYNCMEQGSTDGFQNLDLIQAIANQVKPGYIYDALSGKKKFDSPTMTEALKTFGTLFNNGVIQKGALGIPAYPDAADAFLQGKAAMFMVGSWADGYTSTTSLKTLADQYGDPAINNTVFMPADFPAVVPNATTGTVFGGPDIGWAMSASSKHKDAAWKLIQFISTSQKAQKMMAATVNPPALKSVPINLTTVATPEQKKALQTLAKDKVVGDREVQNADVKVAFNDALSAVAAGTQSPDQAVKAVQQAIDQAK
jgi:raffinose/stachyose/melibiose transport system substrate-binding protein